MINRKNVTDNSEIANTMNDYFSNVGKNLAEKIKSKKDFKNFMQNPNPNSMYLRPVEVEEVLKLIIGLEIKKAGGDDNIKPQLLKACRNTLKEPIIHIINLSFTKGIVPDKLKIAKVIPIYKKDDKSIPNNYRPISLLSILNKVMEKLMY